MDTSSDPDLRHLTDLLDFLPGPDDPYFWKDFPGEHRTEYLLEKLAAKIPILRKPAPQPVEITDLAKYLMMFFRSDTSAMQDHIGRQTNGVPYELMGQHWLNDLQATCWRLYVRYQPEGTRLEAWPSNFLEWHRQWRERSR